MTYDDYNDDMVQSSTLHNQIQLLEEQIGVYETVKGSLIEEEPEKEGEDFQRSNFIVKIPLSCMILIQLILINY